MHINKLIIMAEKPSVITRSLKKGITPTVSLPFSITGFCDSNLLKRINNKNAILQSRANLEKKKITFIN